MSAVEDNIDSLIGCIVWKKKGQVCSSSDAKKPERKNRSLVKQHPHSPCNSSNQRADENNFPPRQVQDVQFESRADYKLVLPNSECKHVETSLAQHKQHDSSTSALSVTPSAVINSSSMVNGIQIPSISDAASISNIVSRRLQVEAPLMSSVQEKLQPTFDVHRSVLPLSSDAMKNLRPAPDDNDLPEFDFGAASGTSPTSASKLLNAFTVRKKLPAETSMKPNRSLLPVMSSNQSMPDFNRRGLGNFSFQRMLLQNENYDKIIVVPNSEEKHATRTSISVITNVVLRPKDLFDNDDDMAEWCPPIGSLQRQVAPDATRQSATATSSEVPNPNLESARRGLPNQSFSSPSPGAYLPSSNGRLACKFDYPMNQNMKLPDIFQRLNSLVGFNSAQRLEAMMFGRQKN